MPITDLLERNSKLYGDEVALVEINPEVQEAQRVTWKEYSLIQPTSTAPYRREITWSVFDEKANRVANLLLLSSLAVLPASVQYPFVTGGVMIVSTAIAFISGQKPSRRELASVALSFVGILALVLIPLIK